MMHHIAMEVVMMARGVVCVEHAFRELTRGAFAYFLLQMVQYLAGICEKSFEIQIIQVVVSFRYHSACSITGSRAAFLHNLTF